MFKAKPIETYSYLINLCVYVHANPVKDGLVQEITDWPYSNYLEWIGERPGSLADNEFIKDNFDSPDEYKALVMEYLKTRNLPDDIRSYLNTLDEYLTLLELWKFSCPPTRFRKSFLTNSFHRCLTQTSEIQACT